MTERTSPSPLAQAGPSWDAFVVVGSVTLLSALAVADRLVAWLIGQFPASALLWQIRFEYLRPIAVFHDIAEGMVGALSPTAFSTWIVVVATLVAAGASSRIRLARALSFHFLLAGFLLLSVFSLNLGSAYAPVGFPSLPYALLGSALAVPILGSCLRIHADYMGLDQKLVGLTRHLSIARFRLQSLLDEQIAAFVSNLVPTAGLTRRVLASAPRPDLKHRRR